LRNKNFEEKRNTKIQNKTELLVVVVVVVNHFVLGTTVVTKKNTNPWDFIVCTKSFSLEKFYTKKLPDFEGKQKLKVVRF